MNKQIFVTAILVLTLALPALFFGNQEVAGLVIQNDEVAAELDGVVSPQDLEVGDPKILPDNPFYFFKDVGRGIRSAFTFAPEKKAELKLRFANEKIIEADKLAEKGDFKKVGSHLKNYEKDLKDVNKFFEKFKEKKPELAEKFSKKTLNHQFKHQTLLGKFVKKAPVDQALSIAERRDTTYNEMGQLIGYVEESKSGEVVEIISTAIGDPVDQALSITERREATYNEMGQLIGYVGESRGSLFKPLKNLEVLKGLEEKVPEQAKEAIRLAQENSLKRFKNQFEKMDEDQRGQLKGYIENVGGDETMYIKVFDHLKFAEIKDDAQKEITEAREKLFTRFENRVKEASDINPELAKKLLKPLTQGSMGDLKAIKELEYNFDPVLTKPVLEAKKEALERFKEKIEKVDTPELFKEFNDKVNERFVDVKHFDIFDDVKEILPEEKKKFAEYLKERATEKMGEHLREAKTTEIREARVRSLVGDSPEYIGIIQDIRNTIGSDLADELMSKQVKRIEERVSRIEDPLKLKIFEDKLQESNVKSTIQQLRPKVLEEVKIRAKEKTKDIKEEEAKSMIEKAQNYLRDLKAKAEGDKFNERFQLAEVHLNKAKRAYEQKDFGEAFGQATSAFNLLRKIGAFLIVPSAIAPQPSTVPMPVKEPVQLNPVTEPASVLCTQEYNPVCGIDGRTYSNRCVAEKQNKMEVAYAGECKKEEAIQPKAETSVSPLPIMETIKEKLSLEAEKIPESTSVSIKGFSFEPSEVKVLAGGKVVFTNFDNALHNVKGNVSLRDMKQNDIAVLIAPDKPGTYEYFCSYHPYMKGKIIVQ